MAVGASGCSSSRRPFGQIGGRRCEMLQVGKVLGYEIKELPNQEHPLLVLD